MMAYQKTENSAASTADWIDHPDRGVILRYDLAVLVEPGTTQDVSTVRGSASIVPLRILPVDDLVSRYAAAAQYIFRPYAGPDEDLGFDPDASVDPD